MIVSKLERNKRYPPEALALERGESGVTRVYFELDREGKVTSSRVINSSGSATLDQEALDLLVRASPFPAPPEHLGPVVHLQVPIRFTGKTVQPATSAEERRKEGLEAVPPFPPPDAQQLKEEVQKEGRIFTLPSNSMLPTLPVGGFVRVNPLLPTEQPRIGDIVAFYAKDKRTLYVKRIIGTGGDRIQIIDGVLHINGQPVKRERVGDYIRRLYPQSGVWVEAGQPVKRWRETLPNGVSYMTLDIIDNGFYDNTPVYKVPPNHYFMMGDNRDNSTDSRVLSQVGYVPVENITGKVSVFVPQSVETGK